MMEILLVVTVILVLAAVLLPAIGLVRERVHRAQAQTQIGHIAAALQIYRDEDPLRSFPPPLADRTLRHGTGGAVGDLLAIRGLAVSGANTVTIDAGAPVIVDPWKQPVMYTVDAHTSGDGIAVMPADTNGDRVRVPDDVADWNPPRGVPARQVVPYAYVWSWGKPGAGSTLRDQARYWIYVRESPPVP